MQYTIILLLFGAMFAVSWGTGLGPKITVHNRDEDYDDGSNEKVKRVSHKNKIYITKRTDLSNSSFPVITQS